MIIHNFFSEVLEHFAFEYLELLYQYKGFGQFVRDLVWSSRISVTATIGCSGNSEERF